MKPAYRTGRLSKITELAFRSLMLVVLSSVCLIGFAQEEKPQNRPYADHRLFHLGFHVGLHTQDLVIANLGKLLEGASDPVYGEIPMFSPGFSVGIIANFSPMLGLDLRLIPTLHLGERTIAFSNSQKEELESFSLRSNMLEVPFMVKYSSRRLNNVRPYMTGGIYASLMIGQKANAVIRFKPLDYGIKVGVGCDFYLPYFKLSPEITLSYGFPNVLETERPDMAEDMRYRYTKTMRRISTRMILMTFNFE